MTDMTEKLNESIRLKGDVDIIEMEDTLLLNAGTSRFTKISGEYAALVKKIIPLLRVGARIDDICKALADDLDEMDVMEILETLDGYQILQKTRVNYGLSDEELTRYRQQINHFVARFPAAASEDYIEQLKRLNIFIYGGEMLGARLIQALTLLGVGSVNVLTNLNEIVPDEVYNTSFYRQEDIGRNKQEVIVSRCKELNPHVKCRVYYEKEDFDVLKDSDLVILAFDVPNYAAYEEINRFLIKHKKACLLCGFMQDELFFGPTMVPGETACFACFDKRCRGNKSFYHEYSALLEFMKQKTRPGNALGARLDMISALVVNEVTLLLPYLQKNINQLLERRLQVMTMEEAVQLNNIFRYGRPATWNNQITIEFYPQFRLVNNPVLRLPRCEVCGSTADKRPMVTPWSLPLE